MAGSKTIALRLAAIAGASFVLGACGTTDITTRDAWIRMELTPELDTLYQRPVDVSNSLAIMHDTNWRMLNQDLGRVFYTDRPSRLTREPIPW